MTTVNFRQEPISRPPAGEDAVRRRRGRAKAARYLSVVICGMSFRPQAEPAERNFGASPIQRCADIEGRYNVLEVETRGPFSGPRACDHTGLPLRLGNQSTVKQRFHRTTTSNQVRRHRD
jgi:hypothetical protein